MKTCSRDEEVNPQEQSFNIPLIPSLDLLNFDFYNLSIVSSIFGDT